LRSLPRATIIEANDADATAPQARAYGPCHTSSVGSLGAIAVFLAFAVAGLVSEDDQFVRAAYIANELMGWYVILPLLLAALLIGVAQSLATPWGLLRHYWVLAKLLLTLGDAVRPAAAAERHQHRGQSRNRHNHNQRRSHRAQALDAAARRRRLDGAAPARRTVDLQADRPDRYGWLKRSRERDTLQ
jgi:hypothetical protein